MTFFSFLLEHGYLALLAAQPLMFLAGWYLYAYFHRRDIAACRAVCAQAEIAVATLEALKRSCEPRRAAEIIPENHPPMATFRGGPSPLFPRSGHPQGPRAKAASQTPVRDRQGK